MNRRIFTVTVAILVIALAVTACGKKPEPAEATAATTEAAVETTMAETTEPTVETLEVIYDPQVEDWEDETTPTTKETEPKATEPKATESTKATDPDETKAADSTEATEPEETVPEETTKPTEPKPTESKTKDPLVQEYEDYLNMTPEQQQAKFEKMGAAAFMDWYQRAKAAYDAAQDYIDISGGEIDLGQLG